MQCWCPAGGSEGGDVIKCIVQLLADGFVLHLLRIHFVCRWGGRAGGQCRGQAAERERVAVSRGPRVAGACRHRRCGCGPISHLRAEPRSQQLCAPTLDTTASSLPPPRTPAHPLTLAKPCPAPPGARCGQRALGRRDMGSAGTFYLLDHQWFSPALPQTSLQTPPGSQPVGA